MSQTPRAVLKRFIDAFHRGDVEALVALYVPKASNHQVAAGPPVVGREALRRDFEAFFRAFPDAWIICSRRPAASFHVLKRFTHGCVAVPQSA